MCTLLFVFNVRPIQDEHGRELPPEPKMTLNALTRYAHRITIIGRVNKGSDTVIHSRLNVRSFLVPRSIGSSCKNGHKVGQGDRRHALERG